MGNFELSALPRRDFDVAIKYLMEVQYDWFEANETVDLIKFYVTIISCFNN